MKGEYLYCENIPYCNMFSVFSLLSKTINDLLLDFVR